MDQGKGKGLKILVATSERFSGCIVETLERMGHQVVGVVSPVKGIYARQFTGPRFWFYHLRGWDILKCCQKKNIPFRISKSLEDGSIRSFIKGGKPDLLLLFGWPTLVLEKTLNLFPLGGMNLHPSLLPRHRGGDPLFWIVDGDEGGFGVTFHKVTMGLDEGPVYLQVGLPKSEWDTYDDLYFKVLHCMVRRLPEAIRNLRENPAGKPQVGNPTYVKGFRQSFRLLDPDAELEVILRRTRACFSHHTRLTAVRGQLISFSKIKRFRNREPEFASPNTVQKIGLFSMDVTLAGGYVQFSGLKFCGAPLWKTPWYLIKYCKPGNKLDSQRVVRALMKSRN